MEDIVDYKLPMGILGQWAHPFLVKPKLQEIFEYRKQKLTELFGTYSEKINTEEGITRHDILN